MNEGTFSEIAFSQEFHRALQAAIEKPILKNEFDKMPLPNNCERETIWNFIQSVQHMAGWIDPIKPWFKGDYDHCWAYFPKTVQAQLSAISNLTAPTSTLNSFILTHPDSLGVFLDLLSEEIAACGHRDGISLSTTQIRNILIAEEDPKNDEETIVMNFKRLFTNMPRIIMNGTVSRLLVSDINDQLLHNSSLKNNSYVNIWDKSLIDEKLLNDPNYISDIVDSVINGMRNSQDMRDIIISYLRSYKILQCIKYLSQAPCLTEFLLRRAFTLIKKVPVLGFVPIIYYEDTHNNAFRKAHEDEVKHGGRDGLCCTWDFAGSINMLYLGIQTVKKEILNAQDKENKLKIYFAHIPELSSRQKAFLVLATLNNTRQFTIKFYQNKYGVCYATARNELTELYDKGFLSIQKKGRSFVFRGENIIKI